MSDARADLLRRVYPRVLASYPYVDLVRGTLHADLGHTAQARVHLLAAHANARNAAERAQIEAKLAELGPGG
jgi:predicted RNA polymerase sigma factor